MRGRIVIAASVLMTLCIATLPAQDAFVVYLEGVVEYRDGSSWVESFIGDTIPSGTEVRIGDGGFLEVVTGDRTVRYTESGRYRVGAVDTARETGSTDLGGLIRGTVSRFTRTASASALSTRSTAAGVRASEAAQQPTVEWAGDESPQELIADGIAALNDGDTEEASFLFEDAYSFADGAVRNEAGFFFIYTLYLLDERDLALEVIGEVTPEPTEPYYPDYALVAGEILLDAGRASTAAELLRALLGAHGAIGETRPLTAQATYFLLGRATEDEDGAAATRYFRQAAEIAPTTALGMDAASR